jgi:hypothetical protein
MHALAGRAIPHTGRLAAPSKLLPTLSDRVAAESPQLRDPYAAINCGIAFVAIGP